MFVRVLRFGCMVVRDEMDETEEWTKQKKTTKYLMSRFPGKDHFRYKNTGTGQKTNSHEREVVARCGRAPANTVRNVLKVITWPCSRDYIHNKNHTSTPAVAGLYLPRCSIFPPFHKMSVRTSRYRGRPGTKKMGRP